MNLSTRALLNFCFNVDKTDLFISNMAFREEVAKVNCDVDNLNSTIVSTIWDVALSLGMCGNIFSNKSARKNPWYDLDCRLSKKDVTRALKVCKDSNFSVLARDNYFQMKASHRKLLKLKKKNFALVRLKIINNCRSSVQFWRVINASRTRINSRSDIDIDTWYTYLRECFPPLRTVSPTDCCILTQSVAELDQCITVDEIVFCLRKCKNGKAPGSDGINFNFLKTLPQNWILFLNSFFNKILIAEKVPEEWGKLSTFMLYKKGDASVPDNYRPITLINCVAKIFTQILCNRLV